MAKKTKKQESYNIPLTREKSREEAMNEAVLWVDWEKVRDVMSFLDWSWGDEPLTTTSLKGRAIELIQVLFTQMDEEDPENLKNKVFRASSGGITTWMEVEDGEISEISCGFVIDEYIADMEEIKVITVVD